MVIYVSLQAYINTFNLLLGNTLSYMFLYVSLQA